MNSFYRKNMAKYTSLEGFNGRTYDVILIYIVVQPSVRRLVGGFVGLVDRLVCLT